MTLDMDPSARDRHYHAIDSTQTLVASVNQQAAHLSVAEIQDRYLRQCEKELDAMRLFVDGQAPYGDFWYKKGFRAVTLAWRQALQVAKARESNRS